MAIVGNVGRVLSLEPEPDPRSVNCVIRELQKRKSLVLEKQFFQNNFFNILKGLLEVCENKSENLLPVILKVYGLKRNPIPSSSFFTS